MQGGGAGCGMRLKNEFASGSEKTGWVSLKKIRGEQNMNQAFG
jgi:hypothetical protein